MVNSIHTDGIPATADATMMRILTHGFSSLRADHKRRPNTTTRAADTALAAEIRGLISVKAPSAKPATAIDKGAVNASAISDTQVRRSKLLRVTRQVEVVHVKTVNGARRVVKREVQQVECKRVRKH